ncbi:PadR family transcriptional regulator [Rhizobium leguminosarum]|nr:PadR family transcriptional regulator [Rhizobium leguminosarum]MBY2976872.1 PadR family transcriptional regulator [Rhizobium leguminosarum]MBY3005423.1 PadR family transcriptional regulator [Rhizobium leguminosarum]
MEVLAAILNGSGQGSSGVDIAKVTGLASGSLYPILIRLERAGWLSSAWEAGEPAELGRPRRRFYRLTALGAKSTAKIANDLAPAREARLAWGQ